MKLVHCAAWHTAWPGVGGRGHFAPFCCIHMVVPLSHRGPVPTGRTGGATDCPTHRGHHHTMVPTCTSITNPPYSAETCEVESDDRYRVFKRERVTEEVPYGGDRLSKANLPVVVVVIR